MPKLSFPVPQGTALRWSAAQANYLREEGFGEAAVSAVRPLYLAFAESGDFAHIQEAQRLLTGES